MNNTILDVQLLPILLALGFLSIVMLWTIIKYYKNTILIAILIPLTIISFTTTYVTLERVLGYPITQTIPEGSLYITHVVSDHNNVIYVWILEPDETVPRANTIPLTTKNEKRLKEAQKRQSQGIPQLIREGEEGKQGAGQTRGGEYVLYNFQVSDPQNLKNKDED